MTIKKEPNEFGVNIDNPDATTYRRRLIVPDVMKKYLTLNKDQIKEKGLTIKQELFCQVFINEPLVCGNMTKSYALAYNVDCDDPKQYNYAKSMAWTTMQKPYVNNRINEIMGQSTLNEATLDGQLSWLIHQNGDLKVKMMAIKEANKLQGRIQKKVNHEVNHKFSLKELATKAMNASSEPIIVEDAEIVETKKK